MAWSEDLIHEKIDYPGHKRIYKMEPDSAGHTLEDDVWSVVYEANVIDNTTTSGVIDVIWDGSDVKIAGATGSGTIYLVVRGEYTVN